MSEDTLCLYSLPNEILVSVLSTFETKNLLLLITVSRRFHSLILRIIHFRLLLAATAPQHNVILEAYHPSQRYRDSYFTCSYLGTDGLSSQHEGEGSLYADCGGPQGRFARLGALYSRFRPERPSVQGSMPIRRIARAAPSQVAAGTTTQPLYANTGDGGNIKIIHTVHLDAGEQFEQFCAHANLVTLGPRRGVFLSTVRLLKERAGVMRLFKSWLVERMRIDAKEDPATLKRSSTFEFPMPEHDKGILWADEAKNVGLRFAVRQPGGLTEIDENVDIDDVSLTFSLEIRELVVRTTHLMLAVEKSSEQSHNRSDQAYILWGFT